MHLSRWPRWPGELLDKLVEAGRDISGVVVGQDDAGRPLEVVRRPSQRRLVSPVSEAFS